MSVEVGLIAGTATHLCILLYKASNAICINDQLIINNHSSINLKASKPRVTVEERSIEDDDTVTYYLVVPDRGLFFPSVSDIRNVPIVAMSFPRKPKLSHHKNSRGEISINGA